eukprot:12193563-Alexandrium_andersonii.AAC.1
MSIDMLEFVVYRAGRAPDCCIARWSSRSTCINSHLPAIGPITCHIGIRFAAVRCKKLAAGDRLIGGARQD